MASRMTLFLTPIVLWLIWLLLPLARGRRIRRARVSISLSLLTLLYFLAVENCRSSIGTTFRRTFSHC
jgi:hypothetical protein